MTTESSLEQELEELEVRRPVPPSVLYKYLGPERVDVLENRRIRFAPPLNTNDIFEVRQTFDLLMGPKMHRFFKEVSTQVDFDEALSGALADGPLAGLSPELAKSLFSTFVGGDLELATREILGRFIDQMPEHLNTPENVQKLLERVAGKQLLLSLSDRPDSSPMWAHYAANSAGLVIAFDTSSSFFQNGRSGEKRRLHKIEYFDGRIPELMDNPYAALISKQKDWEYEREWRLYVNEREVDETLVVSGDQIQLVSFPSEAVLRVTLGLRTSPQVETKIRNILRTSYPGADLTRVRADRLTASLVELPLS